MATKTPEELEKERQAVLDSVTEKNIKEQTQGVPQDGSVRFSEQETNQMLDDVNNADPLPLTDDKSSVGGMTREQYTAPIDEEIKSIDSQIGEWEKERNDYRQRSNEQLDTNKKAQLWGGITESAAALTNLFGSMAGAAPQRWNSPQEGWQQRVDTIVRERDAKLQNYKTMRQNLENQRRNLTFNKAKAEMDYDIKQQQINRYYDVEKLKQEHRLEVIAAKAEVWGEQQKQKHQDKMAEIGRSKGVAASKISSDAYKAVSAAATRRFNQWYKTRVSQGYNDDEAALKNAYDGFYEQEMNNYTNSQSWVNKAPVPSK